MLHDQGFRSKDRSTTRDTDPIKKHHVFSRHKLKRPLAFFPGAATLNPTTTGCLGLGGPDVLGSRPVLELVWPAGPYDGATGLAGRLRRQDIKVS